ncbi:MAG: hypothetical protein Q4B42_03625 [Oscillospiraceae bacterium]|nr:hypothetical protein [Oscillospiraceae bacterium]
MTSYGLLDAALALLLTNRGLASEYVEYAAPLINMLLAETFEINNSLRLSKGLAELEAPPCISSLEEELPCEEELLRSALPQGLVAKLIMDDGDMSRVAYFQNQYVNAALDAGKYAARPIEDVYKDGEA